MTELYCPEFQKPRHPYEVALEQRNLEIRLFWQRSNYFLVLNSGLAVAFFSKSKPELSLMLSIFGMVISLLWILTNFGSKFWQERWEYEVSCKEPSYTDGYVKLFDKNANVKGAVELRLVEASGYNKKVFSNKRIFKEAILAKPSVSFMMIYLSIVTLLFWLAAFFFELSAFSIK